MVANYWNCEASHAYNVEKSIVETTERECAERIARPRIEHEFTYGSGTNARHLQNLLNEALEDSDIYSTLQEIDKPMTKDRTYYKNRLKETADHMYAEETKGMALEQVLREKPEVFDNMNIVGFLSRIGFNFPEARALIPKILDSLDEDDANKVYELTWVSKSSQKCPMAGN